MKNIILIFSALLMLSSVVFAQNNTPVLSRNYDKPAHKPLDIAEALKNSTATMSAFTPTYGEGIKGLALDLSAQVAVRIPEVVDNKDLPSYNQQSSFSLLLWVKTIKGAQQGTPIMSNKKMNNNSGAGWCLGTKENGAWYWNMSDGKTQYNYEPTAQKQGVNNGEWHQIAISFDRSKQELWLYFDGRNVAIYQIEKEILSLESELKTVIGGSYEYTDWGSRSEWTAFNGLIDELAMWDKPITAAEVQANYRQFTGSSAPALANNEIPDIDKLKIQVWNIWHGGRRFGQHVGVERTIEILKRENADIIGLVETYGSGAIIADSLGYYFYLISSNLSIMSRYPIEECIKVFKPFFSGGALINLGNGQKLAFFDIWLNYAPDFCELHKGDSIVNKFLEKEKTTRVHEITSILNNIETYTKQADNVPVIIVGDFNCDSHLDWTEETRSMHNGLVVDMPVSRIVHKAGFTDSYRAIHPKAASSPGYTWSPIINNAAAKPDCLMCRIDFIYYKGKKLTPYHSESFNYHPIFWPSDHGSLVSSFLFSK